MQKPTTPRTKRVQTNTCTTIQETSHTNTNAPNKSTNTISTRVEPSLPPLKPHQKQIKDAALIFQLTWYRRHENNYQIASIDEIESYFKQNHIIILPPDLKMPFAITHYVTQSTYYVKYLHWNNNCIMDGFIYLKNNNDDESELRKNVYGKRFYVYTSSNDFIWSNLSFTIQAKSFLN